MKKTQFFSAEIILVFIVFISLFFMAVLFWETKTLEFDTNQRLFDMELGAANLAEILTTSPGKPLNWTILNFEQIGLADDYAVINPRKLDNFFYISDHNYSYARELLGIPEYDYYVRLKDVSGNIVRSFGNYSGFSVIIVWEEKIRINNTNYLLEVGVSD
jgi:hypothetical protein